MTARPNAREVALELIRSYEEEGRYVNLLLCSPKVRVLCREDIAFVTALLYTTVEKKLTYDYFISAYAKRPIDKISPEARDIIRLGMCQIYEMDNIPDYAAVNETVSLCKKQSLRPFINAILREAVRGKANPPYPKREKSLSRYLSVRYSFPLWLVRFFIDTFGEEECERLLISFSKEAPLSLTVNTAHCTRDELVSLLAEYSPKPAPYTKRGIVLGKRAIPTELSGFREGAFFIQDEASRIAGEALSAGPSDIVVDVCAAPGGKSFFAAGEVGDGGRIYSFELHESKLSLITDGAKRLGLANITVRAVDALLPDESLFGKADRLICDVPCSGLGVLSKKPDLRYKEMLSLEELPPLQYSILEKSVKYLKVGGRVVYSTCTLNPAENEGVTDKFISEHPEFCYEKIEVGALFSDSGKLTLLPSVHNTDGFYIAAMRKIK